VSAPDLPAACGSRSGFRRFGGSRAEPSPSAEQRAKADRVAFLGGDLGQRAGRRRGHLDRDLVGFELEQGLVGLHGVADLLEPLADGRLGDGFAQVGTRISVAMCVCPA
jgi:hypothetical protein